MTTPGKTIDLSSLDTAAACDKGFEIELKHPVTKKGLEQYITVLGRDGKVYREHLNFVLNEKRKQSAINLRRGIEQELSTREQEEQEAIDSLVAVTVAFRNIYYKSEKLDFTPANARRLYTEQLFIMRQVDEAFADLENFMKS